MKLISRYPDDPNLRFAAYEALGSLPVEKSAYMLARGMMDPEESVRLSVARAIDHNCNEQLVSGISNMLSDEEMAPAIVQAILDAQSERIFLELLENTIFWGSALQYLIHRAHPDLRKFYARLLQDQGKQDMARVILSSRDNTAFEHSKWRICVVDDSRMVLQAYRSKLYELGFEPVLFSSPQEALAWLENQKPALLFTDLNMPKIDGIELIKGVRKNYSKVELPVVLVTSQKDVDNSNKAYQAGANNILIKPFNKEDLQGVVDNLLGNRSRP